MCGIFALAWRDGRRSPAEMRQAAQAMQDSLSHRGPDGTGMIERPGLILGHLRLAIIDPAGGAQPMRSADGRVALSYNGECYNFPLLMDELARAGWNFASRCDSEVVLAGYSLRGESFDDALNGMYAYAILDERDGRGVLRLATDPVGIKPLFLYQDEEVILCASELRAIVVAMRSLDKLVEIDSEAVEAYLRLGWVPAPRTLVRNARKLLPGERWQIDPEYWTTTCTSVRQRPVCEPFLGSEHELDDELRLRLQAVIRRQTISDVPLGFFLSGGIDSSLLLAVASEIGLAAKSFTIGFVGEGHGVARANEAQVARAVAGHLGAPIEVIDVEASTLRTMLGEALDAMDQPLADPACLPLLMLSRLARREVTVALSGDGGDELFAGYPRHRIAAGKARWQALPAPLREMGRMAASMLPQSPSSGHREALRKLRVAHGLMDSPFYVDGPFAGYLKIDETQAEGWNINVAPRGEELMQADIEGQLAGQMLPKTDNMTMHASLECRVPLLDLELVGLASSVPLQMKSRAGVGKRPLRRLLSRYLPAEITERPKQGFRVPLTDWFRGEMADEIRDCLLPGRREIHAHIGPAQIGRMVDEHLSGRAEHSIRLWSLLAFERWSERTLAKVAA